MTTVEPLACDRCKRKLRKTAPVWWFGKPLGESCARRYGLTPERHPRAGAPTREPVGDDEDQLDGLADLLRPDNERRSTCH